MKLKTDLDLGLRVGIFDIETTGLRADYGYMLCICVKEVLKGGLNGKIHTLRIDDLRNPDPKSDKWLIKETVKLLNSFDLLIGWNTSGFDFPFINSRAMKYRILPPQRNFRHDLLFVARGIGQLRSNRLVVWDEFLNGHALKTVTSPKTHIDSIRGVREAINFIVDHCERDVISTEKIYKRFIPLLGKLKRK
jgi:uncharacterized protein YprB with RNaseH-like and TPR domain